MIGQKLAVIIDGFHPESNLLMVGRHQGQCPDIDSYVIINDSRMVDSFGKKYLTEITGASNYDLIGRVISPC
jgi:ribosomal protein S12 methylthiotransferase